LNTYDTIRYDILASSIT